MMKPVSKSVSKDDNQKYNQKYQIKLKSDPDRHEKVIATQKNIFLKQEKKKVRDFVVLNRIKEIVS